jgi:hypothetical protein
MEILIFKCFVLLIGFNQDSIPIRVAETVVGRRTIGADEAAPVEGLKIEQPDNTSILLVISKILVVAIFLLFDALVVDDDGI